MLNFASLYGEPQTEWEKKLKELNIPIVDENEVFKN